VGIWGRVPPLAETVEKIDDVNLEQTRAYAERLASNGRVAMATYGPITESRSLNDVQKRMTD
jgi:hypothetical protein